MLRRLAEYNRSFVKLGRPRGRRLQEPESNPCRRGKENERTTHPHDDRSQNLIRERRDIEGVRMGDVITVNRPVTEREKGRNRCVREISRKEIQQQSPAIPSPPGRPWPDDTPPKCERASQKADVLELMPMFVFESKIVGRWHMPTN